MTEKSENVSNEMLYNQEIGIIPVTSFAYLMNILKQNEDAVAEMLKLVKLRSLGISEGDMMECDDVTCDARSLIFRLAVIGAAIPKIQAPSLQTQVCADHQKYSPALAVDRIASWKCLESRQPVRVNKLLDVAS